MITEYTKSITTDGSGDATVYVGSRINGTVEAVKYSPGTLATDATIVLSGDTTKVAILTKASPGTSDVWFYPRALVNKVADAAAATDAFAMVRLYKEQMKVAVSSGGEVTTGSITVYINEEK